MNRRQFLISVYPAAWEWLPIIEIALLGMLGLNVAFAGATLRLIYTILGLLAAMPLLWLSVAHISDAYLRRQVNAGRERIGTVAMLVLSAASLSGMGQFFGSPLPAWSVPVHLWSVLITLLALAQHTDLSPHQRVVSREGFFPTLHSCPDCLTMLLISIPKYASSPGAGRRMTNIRLQGDKYVENRFILWH